MILSLHNSRTSMALQGSTADALFVDNVQNVHVKVHPVVVFGILDHYNRRPEPGPVRVIGTLLGTVVGNVVEIHNAFGVPHAEKENEVALGQDYHRAMYSHFTRINDKERIVGWYATTLEGGRALNSNSIIIHGFYAGNADHGAGGARLVHLVVDAAVASGRVSIKAYVSTAVNISGAPVANIFHQVKLDVVSTAPEKVCLDRMIRGQEREKAWMASETVATVLPGGGAAAAREDLEASVATLLGMLEQVSGFVDRVVAGEEEPDSTVGCEIADTLSAVPRVRPELFDSIFSGNLQDLLMVSYLSSLTKANLAISEKLSGLRNK
ncbi:hypothetical protein VYU27_006584 [Nannochloropsis oceanica]